MLERMLASRRAWHTFIAATLVGAVLARALCILGDRAGGDDLRLYVYFARLVLDGSNPYDAPEGGPIDPDYGDNPVGELGVFAAVLSLYDTPTALRWLFVLADLATLALIAFGYMRSRWWKAQLMMFYAFNPLILHQWTVSADDKTVLIALIVALLVGLERGRTGAAWVAATALGAFKWISAYFLLPLALYTSRRVGTRRTCLYVLLSLGAIAVTMIPYFPDSLTPIGRRRDRQGLEPYHASFTAILNDHGLYHEAMVTLFTAFAILAVLVLFLSSRIDIREAVVLSIASAFLLLPDNGINRLVLIATPFLFVMRLTGPRLVAIWTASLVTLTGAIVASETFVLHADEIPLGPSLVDLVGPFGSTQYVLLGNVYLVVILALYASDRLRGRLDIGPRALALRYRRGLSPS